MCDKTAHIYPNSTDKVQPMLCAVKFRTMEYSKEEIEKRLKDMLHEMLRGYNQEDSILSLEYDEEKQECNLKMNVHIVEEDDYVGFGVY